MGWIKDTKAGVVGADAKKAWDAGSKYFTPLLNMPSTNPGLSGAIPDWPPMLEAVEAVGWQLHTWAMVSDKQGRPQAMPLFVRP